MGFFETFIFLICLGTLNVESKSKLAGLVLLLLLLTSCKEKEVYIGDIEFSGYTWLIKTSEGKTGPGPNYFYYDNNSVFVDSDGRLHLRIQNRESKRYSNEVVLSEHLGYGKYTIYIDALEHELDPNVVFGFFTYDLNYMFEKNYYHREIDFEIAKWGYEDNENAQFTVQGPSPQAIKRFSIGPKRDYTVSFNWTADAVYFEIYEDDNILIENWSYEGYLVPEPGEESLRLNFWVFNNEPKTNSDSEIIISQFDFEAN